MSCLVKQQLEIAVKPNPFQIGDRESNDVEGALAVGMPAILYTGIVDRGSDRTQANAICGDYAELPRVVMELREALGK